MSKRRRSGKKTSRRATPSQLRGKRRWAAIKQQLRRGVEFHDAVSRVDHSTRRFRTTRSSPWIANRRRQSELSKGFKEAAEGIISMVSEPARKVIDAFKIARGLLRMQRAIEKRKLIRP